MPKMGSSAQDMKNQGKKGWTTRDAFGKQPPVEVVKQLEAPFVGYVNYTPSESDKVLFDEWVHTADIAGILDRIGDDGYKISCGYDEKNKTYLASLTCRRTGFTNAGYVLSLRGNTAAKAFWRLLFVHAAIAGEQWERLLGDTDDKW